MLLEKQHHSFQIDSQDQISDTYSSMKVFSFNTIIKRIDSFIYLHVYLYIQEMPRYPDIRYLLFYESLQFEYYHPSTYMYIYTSRRYPDIQISDIYFSMKVYSLNIIIHLPTCISIHPGDAQISRYQLFTFL